MNELYELIDAYELEKRADLSLEFTEKYNEYQNQMTKIVDLLQKINSSIREHMKNDGLSLKDLNITIESMKDVCAELNGCYIFMK
jgi:hypothetical protein